MFQEENEKVKSPGQSENGTTSHLLIVDDEPNIRVPLARAFDALGYRVAETGTGEGALALLQKSPFDLMVLDMQMPDIDGVEVMQKVHRHHPQLLIVVLTGHPTIDNAIAAVKLGAVDFIRKPAGTHEIVKIVAETLHKFTGKRYREPVAYPSPPALDEVQEFQKFPRPKYSPSAGSEYIVYAPPLTLNCQTHQLTVGDLQPRVLKLSKGEVTVLSSLMARPNQGFTCRDLVKALWDYDTDEVDADCAIRLYIYRLRQKIETNPKKPRFIHTVRGQGYLFSGTKN